jgi:hypothetical protein
MVSERHETPNREQVSVGENQTPEKAKSIFFETILKFESLVKTQNTF